MAGDWKTYSRALEEVYALAGTIDSAYRPQRIDVLRRALPKTAINWDTLAANGQEWESIDQWRPYETAWFALREALFQARDEIVRKMLQSSTTLS